MRAPSFANIVNNGVIAKNILNYNRNETNINQYYWHNDDGIRYAHLYDGERQWYGWYGDDGYYWTRWDQDHWWYQAPDRRWCYWQDGYWWYQRPEQPETVYVYVENTYYQYGTTQGGVVLKPVVLPALPASDDASSDSTPEPAPVPAPAPAPSPAPEPAPAPAPAAQTAEKAYYSNDGTRMVAIFGEKKDAFLYDRTTGEEPAFLAFLASDVAEVRFSNTGDGSALQILLVLKDGTFKMFDAAGKAVGAPATSATAPTSAGQGTFSTVREAAAWIGAGGAVALGLGVLAVPPLVTRLRKK